MICLIGETSGILLFCSLFALEHQTIRSFIQPRTPLHDVSLDVLTAVLLRINLLGCYCMPTGKYLLNF
jgi:hypothetical protein